MQTNNYKKKDNKIIKQIKQNAYKWHKTLALITILPVIFWCISGIMHPFMAHFFKPNIPNLVLQAKPLGASKPHFSLLQVLQYNKIKVFKNARLVTFNNTTYYQIKKTDNRLLYINATTAQLLSNADIQYAHWLARYFLNDTTSTIASTKVITQFDTQYKYVNRYLPVYKITFNRPDKMQVYLETVSGKLATFNPISRQWFIWFFDTFHNWSFLNAITNSTIRTIVMLFLLTIISLSALSGLLIYGLFYKQFKKAKTITNVKTAGNYHRQYGLFISLFTLGFAFSGAFHLWQKPNTSLLPTLVYEPLLYTNQIKTDTNQLVCNWQELDNFGLIKFKDQIFYRCQYLPSINQPIQKTAQKDSNPSFVVAYVNATTNTIAQNLDLQYAQFLANYFDSPSNKKTCSKLTDQKLSEGIAIKSARLIKTDVLYNFDKREYGFVNKRLPVVKLAYATSNNTTYYIETATSRLAAIITDTDRAEGYCFAFLHKFLFMDWAGKTIRDLTMVLAVIVILFVSVSGIRLLIKK